MKNLKGNTDWRSTEEERMKEGRMRGRSKDNKNEWRKESKKWENIHVRYKHLFKQTVDANTYDERIKKNCAVRKKNIWMESKKLRELLQELYGIQIGIDITSVLQSSRHYSFRGSVRVARGLSQFPIGSSISGRFARWIPHCWADDRCSTAFAGLALPQCTRFQLCCKCWPWRTCQDSAIEKIEYTTSRTLIKPRTIAILVIAWVNTITSPVFESSSIFFTNGSTRRWVPR